jgi:hypothetical protein
MYSEFNSADEYFQAMEKEMMDFHKNNPDPRMKELLPYWLKKIEERIKEKWVENLTNKSDSYFLSELDVMTAYKDATGELMDDVLGRMVDKGTLQTNINESGSLSFSLTDKGREIGEALNRGDINEARRLNSI